MATHTLSFLLLLTACTGVPDGSGKPGGESAPVAGDEDGDGYTSSEGDCDDTNSDVHPGASELCNSIDDNCDGTVDEGAATTYYQDADSDGFGNASITQDACEAPAGYVLNGNDCDDTQGSVYPDNVETCDNLDNDCDGTIDEGVTTTWYADADGDGYGDPDAIEDACEQPPGYVTDATDCDDTSDRAFPGNAEVCDEEDNNCDGTVDEGVTTTWYADFDNDTYGSALLTQEACAVPSGYTDDALDCDDGDATINPAAAESCNGVDDDCDGTIDEDSAADAATWYADADSDGYGDATSTTVACTQPPGHVADATDCDDSRALTNPAATEFCNGRDDNCNGTTDEDTAADAATWYIDSDADGYGNALVSDVACTQPTGFVGNGSDCNDGASAAYPGAPEACDGIDNDCNGVTDEDSAVDASTWYRDSDGDGYGDPAASDTGCDAPTGFVGNATDCDDTRAATFPGATEYCNSLDDDCDGTADEDAAVDVRTWYQDADGDGYGNAAATDFDCNNPAGYVSNDDDCDDVRALTNPGASEFCNDIDDDCDGTIDDSAVDATTWYLDADADGYSGNSITTVACDAPTGYNATSTDCDDYSNTTYPGADETCDGADNDCDGTADNNPIDGDTYYLDDDGDGMGDGSGSTTACSAPAGYADNQYDCDDADPTEPVVADIGALGSAQSGTLSDPFYSLQDAIDASYTCVVAFAGTYTEALDIDKSIDIWGVEGSDFTIIDGDSSGCSSTDPTACAPAVRFASGANRSATLRGFTITGGSGEPLYSSTSTSCADSAASHSGQSTCTVDVYEYCGGGVYINGDDPTLQDIVIRGNDLPEFQQVSNGSFAQIWMYSYGGGACVRDANPVFEDVTIYDNFADQGGGIHATDGANLTIEQGIIAENDATDGGGIGMDNASGSFTNTVVYCNRATTDGGGLFTETSGTSVFVNSVFYRNESAVTGYNRGSEGYLGVSTSMYLYNSITEANSTVYAFYCAGTGEIEYSNLYNDGGGGRYSGGCSVGPRTISASPNFTSGSCDGSLSNDDFSLISSSGSIDAGDPDVMYNDVDGTRNDLGAYGGPGGSW